MPTHCAHFKLLSERVTVLLQKFVADQIADEKANPLTFQPDLDRLAAFRLLVHAEIEDFLETKAEDNIATLVASVNTPPWARKFPELLSLAMVLKKAPPTGQEFDSQKFTVFVQELVGGAKKAISENNGIKSQSFLLLSICAGKTVDEVDSVLSGSLNSYGKDRGDVAHKSVTHSTTLQAPSSEVRTATSLVAQIATYFDVIA